MEEEFARRSLLLRDDLLTEIIKENRGMESRIIEKFKGKFTPETEFEYEKLEKDIVRNVFELLIERAQSVIAAGYEGLGVQDLKDLAFNEYGIDMEKE